MQDFDTTLGEASSAGDEREDAAEKIWDFLQYLLKRFILFVSFGTGVLGFLWLLGRIFKR